MRANAKCWIGSRHSSIRIRRIHGRATPRQPAPPLPSRSPHSTASVAFRRCRPGEDRAFVSALARLEAAVSDTIRRLWSTVSGRIHGRAHGGMADTIRRRMRRQDEFADVTVEPAADAYRRIDFRRRVRLAWREPVPVAEPLAADLGIPMSRLWALLAARTFGAAWDDIGARSPFLIRRRVRFTELPRQIGYARELLGHLSVPSIHPAVSIVRHVAALVPAMQQRAAQLDAAGAFPSEDIAALRNAGALAMPLPVEHATQPGGSRVLADALADILVQIGIGSLAAGRIVEAHVNARYLIARYGTPRQTARASGRCQRRPPVRLVGDRSTREWPAHDAVGGRYPARRRQAVLFGCRPCKPRAGDRRRRDGRFADARAGAG